MHSPQISLSQEIKHDNQCISSHVLIKIYAADVWFYEFWSMKYTDTHIHTWILQMPLLLLSWLWPFAMFTSSHSIKWLNYWFILLRQTNRFYEKQILGCENDEDYSLQSCVTVRTQKSNFPKCSHIKEERH